MALGSLVKTLQNIMRKDAGINGDAQRIEQMTWLFFLKIYDAKEEEWEFHDDSYKSVIPERLRWHSWAVDNCDGKAPTGAELLDFINNDLFKTLAGLDLGPNTPLSQVIVKAAFTDANNYMKVASSCAKSSTKSTRPLTSLSTKSAMPSERFTKPSSRTCRAQAMRVSSTRRVL